MSRGREREEERESGKQGKVEGEREKIMERPAISKWRGGRGRKVSERERRRGQAIPFIANLAYLDVVRITAGQGLGGILTGGIFSMNRTDQITYFILSEVGT